MSPYTVKVSGLAPTTTEKELHDFFTFCGTITTIDLLKDTKSAEVHFEKSSAAKTALMLNGGTLDGATLTVTSEVEHHDGPTNDNATPDQSDKPRAAIAAEYLARGYVLGDHVLQRAIDLDNKNGISQRFLTYFKSFDQQAGSRALGPEKTISGKVQETVAQATAQAKAIDEQRGITQSFTEYLKTALATPTGQKVQAFYTSTSKQVLDIHEEAKRIAELHKTNQASAAAPVPAPATTA